MIIENAFCLVKLYYSWANSHRRSAPVKETFLWDHDDHALKLLINGTAYGSEVSLECHGRGLIGPKLL